jgi:hypothetical protein
MNHEPWIHHQSRASVYGKSWVVDWVLCGDKVLLHSECPETASVAAKEQLDTFTRIVACVNAMQGIEDPVAFVQAAKVSLNPFRPFQPETIEAIKEALRNAPSETIIPVYEHLDIARRTIPVDPDDLKHPIHYGD